MGDDFSPPFHFKIAIFFPALPIVLSEAIEAYMGTAIETTGLRILIAEDIADCAESTAILLRAAGHTVTIACDGPSALEQAEAEEPDVLLLDIGLPGMDGYCVAQRLKEHHWQKRPLIVAVTGYGSEEDKRHAAECGIDLHLTKPVEPAELNGLLRRFHRAISV